MGLEGCGVGFGAEGFCKPALGTAERNKERLKPKCAVKGTPPTAKRTLQPQTLAAYLLDVGEFEFGET